jgi:pimeloyl-ACP methyl ester carboxylesterase
LLWGEQDRIIPTATLEAYPAATAETLPDVGHVPQLERPEEFVDALHRLLARM